MAKDTAQTDQAMPPDNLRDILFARAQYEEAKIGEIKAAFDAHDKDGVFKLAEELIYGGPGTTKRP
jgi:hypothetical protein